MTKKNFHFLLVEAHRVEICGGIASGKTTLATLLNRIFLFPIHENFQSNPFWKAFYADPVSTAFETEISFLLQHYHEIKIAIKQTKAFACDFSPLLDLAYAQVTLNNSKREAFTVVYREIQRELPAPDLVIHLACDPEIELERIRRRGRDVEQSLTVDYLAALNRALGDVLREEAKSPNVITIDSAIVDFANNEADRQTVIETVRFRLAQTVGS
ncbi:MAG: deoxynucleoside kinase [Methylococcales bacterium]